jgi:hypothetical protein
MKNSNSEGNQKIAVPRWIFELCLKIALEHEGDGKTKESAIRFVNAKNHDVCMI